MVSSRRTLLASGAAAWMLAMHAMGWPIATRAGQSPQGAPSAQATFRSGVEYVMVDATVVDDDGTPVKGLGAGDFEVSIDGKPRRISSVLYVDMSPRPAPPVRPGSLEAHYSSNEADAGATMTDRSIVLAVDHGSFLPGRGRQTLEAAKRFLDQLDPAERVAFAAFPAPGVFLPPGRDRAAIKRELGLVMGSAEVIESSNPQISLAIGESFEVASGSRVTLDAVFERECGAMRETAERDACLRDIQISAPFVVSQVRTRTIQSLNGLQSVLERLRVLDGRKTLVLVSAGLFLADERSSQDFLSDLRNVTNMAAAANVTIQVLHVDTALADAFGAERSRITDRATIRDIELMARGLDALVGLNGGSLFRIVAGAEFAFRRVYREMTGFYELAVEPEASDRDGKPHSIKVKVSRKNTTVRNRQQFTSRPIEATVQGADSELAAVIRSGRILRDLPLRVSTQTLRDPAGDRLRVLVRADIGSAASGPADLRVGLAVFDDRGQPTGSTLGAKHLFPSRGPEASWPYLETLSLRPGAYTLRLAVADVGGRIGSVLHNFEARLEPGSGVRLSDLLVIDPDQAGENQFVPSVDGRIHGMSLTALVEVYPERPGTVSDVSFAVADRADGPPMMSVKADLVDRAPERRVSASGAFDLRLLPPGEYVVTATASDRGRTLGKVVRGFAVVRTTLAAPSVAGSPRVRFVPGDMGAFGRPFSRADVLGPEALAYFLARMKAADLQAPTPAVTTATAAAAAGRFDAVLPAIQGADASNLSVAFLRGLALFSLGDLEAAAGQFRTALRTASNFLPAAFYLGACYAAGGRDEEAVGAWQTSLISESDARIIFDVLSDALLRLQDGEQLAAVIREARERWPDDDLFLPRLAVAQNLAGDAKASLDTLDGYLTRRPDDTSVMVLMLRVLYDAHAAGRLVRGAPEDAALATRLAEMYKAAGGPNVPLLDRWVVYIRQADTKR